MRINGMSIRQQIGAILRRYGGSRYVALRKFLHRCAATPEEAREIIGLWRKDSPAGSEDRIFYDRFYPEDAAGASTQKAKEGIVCMYDGRMHHGGLTDRLRGALTTYRLARRLGIPFYIYWNHPFQLETYLQPAATDWRIAENELSFCRDDAYPVIIQDKHAVANALRLRAGLHNRPLQTHVYSNSYNARGHYSELYRELFRPSVALEAETRRHLDVLGDNYEVFTFRFLTLLGDFTDHSREVLEGEEREEFIRKVSEEFRRLASQIDRDRKIFVTTDSATFLKIAPQLDSRVYTVEGDVKHIDIGPRGGDDAWMKVFVDQQLIMHSRRVTLMRTGGMYNSGFGRFAAEVGGVPFVDHRF